MLTGKFLVISWVAQVIVAVILLQTLFFKFSGAPEPVYIFTKLGVEPWGRYATAVAELIAGVLLLIPATSAVGALLSLLIIGGAIMSHLTRLGIALPEVGDHGLLFGMAIVVLVGSAVVLWLRRTELPLIGDRLG